LRHRPFISHLDRHLFVQIAGPASLAFLVISVLAVSNEIVSRLNELPGEFLRFADILWLFVYFLPTLVPFILPIAYFVGILMAFGRMGQLGELIAIKASGTSLKQMAAPIILSGFILSGICFWVQDSLQPWGISRASNILYTQLLQRVTLDKLDAGEMIDDFEGFRIHFASKNLATRDLYDVDVIDTGKKETRFYHANEARLVYVDDSAKLQLASGSFWIGPVPTKFEKLELTIPPLGSMTKGSIDRENRNIGQLLDLDAERANTYMRDPSSSNRKELLNVRKELGLRLSLPFSAFAVAMVGAPIGARARRSGRSSTFAAGFAAILLYYILMIVVEPSSSSFVSIPEAVLRAWIPNITVLGLGLWMILKVDRV